MKKIYLLLLFSLVSTVGCADNTTQTSNQTTQQAKQEYQSYVDQLKKLSSQYKEVTTQIQGVLKETGVPTFDENTGELKMQPYTPGAVSATSAAKNQEFGILQTDKDMTVSLDMPGLDRRSLAITIEQQTTLKVRGKRKDSSNTDEITREITLPYPAKDQDASAKYEDGVLTVKVKKAPVTAKSVPVPLQ